jgi:hypothetical protein
MSSGNLGVSFHSILEKQMAERFHRRLGVVYYLSDTVSLLLSFLRYCELTKSNLFMDPCIILK